MIGTGTVLAGRYRLEQRIATGGMGDVWRGSDRVLGRTVAVKCLLGGLPDEPGFVDRFRAEARIMATLSHPSVVEVYDFGDDPAVGVYLVMKYIDGESLSDTLAREGRLSPEATMRLVADVAEALHAAHQKGVTHRDVKPGNLLRRPDGSTVITDFGIARSAGATRHTLTGSLVGTAGYIAPERANGQPATPRSDIYSLGVVAYRCLAGNLPFAGDSVVELALRHVHDEPPPLPADVPPGVRAVVARAMAKDPSDRWPSGAALAAEARRVAALLPVRRKTAVGPAATQRQPTMAAAPPGFPGRSGRGALIAGAAVMVIALVATVAFILGRSADSQAQAPETESSVTTDGVANAGGVSGSAGPGPSSPTPDADLTAGPETAGPTAGTGVTPPALPSNLRASAISINTIRLEWADGSTDEEGFTVWNGQTSNNVGANTTSYDWSGFRPAYRSCFKVRAYNSAGASAWSPTADGDWICTETLHGSGPPVPTDLTAQPISTSTVRLQWTAVPGAEGYTINDSLTQRDVGANATSYEWSGFSPGYYSCFIIRSFNSSGVSDYSGWACATTPAT